jgi:S-DNA-T family DNA segregation ATPase FtsK/SpoIIIE
MPKSETSNSIDGPSRQAPRHRPNWLVAVACFLGGTLLVVALAFYHPEQSVHFTSEPRMKNPVGWIGTETARVMYFSLGLATWLVPVFLISTVYLAVRQARRLAGTRFIAMLLCIVAAASLLAMIPFERRDLYNYFPRKLGGYVGSKLYEGALRDTLGEFGTGLIMGTVYVFGLLFVFTKDIGAEIEKFLLSLGTWRAERAKRKAERDELRRQELEARNRQKAAATSIAANIASAGGPLPAGASGRKTFVPKAADDPLAKAVPVRAVEVPAEESKPSKAVPTVPAIKPEPKPVTPAARSETNGKVVADVATDTKPLAAANGKVELNIVKPEEPKKARVVLPQSEDANYQFPPLSLLKEQVKGSVANSEEEHRRNAENLLRILGEFGVDVTLGEIHVGPVITRYEVVPAAGVRVEKIAGLDKNIALGMRAQSVRILAPIPGKAAVGVEVPNQHPTPVGMRELIESEDWAGAKAELPIALGKDVSGRPLVSDLAKMPHLLIAGATGSGKSVCINSIVASLLYSKSPKDVRLIMVDPKVVELKIFNALPHMLIPVVTEPKKVPAALKWLLAEMEQRYQIFAKANVRNIVGFNSRKKTGKPEIVPVEAQASLTGVDPLAVDDIEIPERLPYIVAIIDELADLMMVAPAEIETSIARLAQLARAAGIHLIIATQRPSVNVITGVIKANLPSRIAFQVASQVDSRTILDTKGADTLIGRGDMLFSPPGTSRLVRAQGAFVSDEEVHAMVEFLKRNGPPQYAHTVQQHIDRAAREDEDAEDGDEDLGDDEDLYQQALDVLRSTKRASTSMLQRRLRIGYNRAARIMEIMEEKGIVGPENGSSPREILVDLDAL